MLTSKSPLEKPESMLLLSSKLSLSLLHIMIMTMKTKNFIETGMIGTKMIIKTNQKSKFPERERKKIPKRKRRRTGNLKL